MLAVANFARVVANFARKDTKLPQKLEANVAIVPTLQNEIDVGEPVVNS